MCYFGDKIKTIVMGGACGMYGEGRVVYRFLVGKPVRKCHLENLLLNGNIVVKRNLQRQDGALIGLLWHMTGTGDGAVVNAAMNIQIA